MEVRMEVMCENEIYCTSRLFSILLLLHLGECQVKQVRVWGMHFP